LDDVLNDAHELNDLAGKPDYKAIEIKLREKQDSWMVLSHDHLPMATDAFRATYDPARP